MLKKIIAGAGIFIASLSIAKAASFYVAPSLLYQNMYIHKITYQSTNPTLSFGYGGTIRDSFFYFGAELFGSFYSYDVNNVPRQNNSLKTRYTYGVSLLPGYVLDTSLMAYLRLTVLATHFEQLSTTKRGFAVGAGLEACLTPHWSARAEYDFAKYTTIKRVGQPRASMYLAGAVYRFG